MSKGLSGSKLKASDFENKEESLREIILAASKELSKEHVVGSGFQKKIAIEASGVLKENKDGFQAQGLGLSITETKSNEEAKSSEPFLQITENGLEDFLKTLNKKLKDKQQNPHNFTLGEAFALYCSEVVIAKEQVPLEKIVGDKGTEEKSGSIIGQQQGELYVTHPDLSYLEGLKQKLKALRSKSKNTNLAQVPGLGEQKSEAQVNYDLSKTQIYSVSTKLEDVIRHKNIIAFREDPNLKLEHKDPKKSKSLPSINSIDEFLAFIVQYKISDYKLINELLSATRISKKEEGIFKVLFDNIKISKHNSDKYPGKTDGAAEYIYFLKGLVTAAQDNQALEQFLRFAEKNLQHTDPEIKLNDLFTGTSGVATNIKTIHGKFKDWSNVQVNWSNVQLKTRGFEQAFSSLFVTPKTIMHQTAEILMQRIALDNRSGAKESLEFFDSVISNMKKKGLSRNDIREKLYFGEEGMSLSRTNSPILANVVEILKQMNPLEQMNEWQIETFNSFLNNYWSLYPPLLTNIENPPLEKMIDMMLSDKSQGLGDIKIETKTIHEILRQNFIDLDVLLQKKPRDNNIVNKLNERLAKISAIYYQKTPNKQKALGDIAIMLADLPQEQQKNFEGVLFSEISAIAKKTAPINQDVLQAEASLEVKNPAPEIKGEQVAIASVQENDKEAKGSDSEQWKRASGRVKSVAIFKEEKEGDITHITKFAYKEKTIKQGDKIVKIPIYLRPSKKEVEEFLVINLPKLLLQYNEASKDKLFTSLEDFLGVFWQKHNPQLLADFPVVSSPLSLMLAAIRENDMSRVAKITDILGFRPSDTLFGIGQKPKKFAEILDPKFSDKIVQANLLNQLLRDVSYYALKHGDLVSFDEFMLCLDKQAKLNNEQNFIQITRNIKNIREHKEYQNIVPIFEDALKINPAFDFFELQIVVDKIIDLGLNPKQVNINIFKSAIANAKRPLNWQSFNEQLLNVSVIASDNILMASLFNPTNTEFSQYKSNIRDIIFKDVFYLVSQNIGKDRDYEAPSLSYKEQQKIKQDLFKQMVTSIIGQLEDQQNLDVVDKYFARMDSYIDKSLSLFPVERQDVVKAQLAELLLNNATGILPTFSHKSIETRAKNEASQFVKLHKEEIQEKFDYQASKIILKHRFLVMNKESIYPFSRLKESKDIVLEKRYFDNFFGQIEWSDLDNSLRLDYFQAVAQLATKNPPIVNFKGKQPDLSLFTTKLATEKKNIEAVTDKNTEWQNKLAQYINISKAFIITPQISELLSTEHRDAINNAILKFNNLTEISEALYSVIEKNYKLSDGLTELNLPIRRTTIQSLLERTIEPLISEKDTQKFQTLLEQFIKLGKNHNIEGGSLSDHPINKLLSDLLSKGDVVKLGMVLEELNKTPQFKSLSESYFQADNWQKTLYDKIIAITPEYYAGLNIAEKNWLLNQIEVLKIDVAQLSLDNPLKTLSQEIQVMVEAAQKKTSTSKNKPLLSSPASSRNRGFLRLERINLFNQNKAGITSESEAEKNSVASEIAIMPIAAQVPSQEGGESSLTTMNSEHQQLLAQLAKFGSQKLHIALANVIHSKEALKDLSNIDTQIKNVRSSITQLIYNAMDDDAITKEKWVNASFVTWMEALVISCDKSDMSNLNLFFKTIIDETAQNKQLIPILIEFNKIIKERQIVELDTITGKNDVLALSETEYLFLQSEVLLLGNKEKRVEEQKASSENPLFLLTVETNKLLPEDEANISKLKEFLQKTAKSEYKDKAFAEMLPKFLEISLLLKKHYPIDQSHVFDNVFSDKILSMDLAQFDQQVQTNLAILLSEKVASNDFSVGLNENTKALIEQIVKFSCKFGHKDFNYTLNTELGKSTKYPVMLLLGKLTDPFDLLEAIKDDIGSLKKLFANKEFAKIFNQSLSKLDSNQLAKHSNLLAKLKKEDVFGEKELRTQEAREMAEQLLRQAKLESWAEGQNPVNQGWYITDLAKIKAQYDDMIMREPKQKLSGALQSSRDQQELAKRAELKQQVGKYFPTFSHLAKALPERQVKLTKQKKDGEEGSIASRDFVGEMPLFLLASNPLMMVFAFTSHPAGLDHITRYQKQFSLLCDAVGLDDLTYDVLNKKGGYEPVTTNVANYICRKDINIEDRQEFLNYLNNLLLCELIKTPQRAQLVDFLLHPINKELTSDLAVNLPITYVSQIKPKIQGVGVSQHFLQVGFSNILHNCKNRLATPEKPEFVPLIKLLEEITLQNINLASDKGQAMAQELLYFSNALPSIFDKTIGLLSKDNLDKLHQDEIAALQNSLLNIVFAHPPKLEDMISRGGLDNPVKDMIDFIVLGNKKDVFRSVRLGFEVDESLLLQLSLISKNILAPLFQELVSSHEQFDEVHFKQFLDLFLPINQLSSGHNFTKAIAGQLIVFVMGNEGVKEKFIKAAAQIDADKFGGLQQLLVKHPDLLERVTNARLETALLTKQGQGKAALLSSYFALSNTVQSIAGVENLLKIVAKLNPEAQNLLMADQEVISQFKNLVINNNIALSDLPESVFVAIKSGKPIIFARDEIIDLLGKSLVKLQNLTSQTTSQQNTNATQTELERLISIAEANKIDPYAGINSLDKTIKAKLLNHLVGKVIELAQNYDPTQKAVFEQNLKYFLKLSATFDRDLPVYAKEHPLEKLLASNIIIKLSIGQEEDGQVQVQESSIFAVIDKLVSQNKDNFGAVSTFLGDNFAMGKKNLAEFTEQEFAWLKEQLESDPNSLRARQAMGDIIAKPIIDDEEQNELHNERFSALSKLKYFAQVLNPEQQSAYYEAMGALHIEELAKQRAVINPQLTELRDEIIKDGQNPALLKENLGQFLSLYQKNMGLWEVTSKIGNPAILKLNLENPLVELIDKIAKEGNVFVAVEIIERAKKKELLEDGLAKILVKDLVISQGQNILNSIKMDNEHSLQEVLGFYEVLIRAEQRPEFFERYFRTLNAGLNAGAVQGVLGPQYFKSKAFRSNLEKYNDKIVKLLTQNEGEQAIYGLQILTDLTSRMCTMFAEKQKRGAEVAVQEIAYPLRDLVRRRDVNILRLAKSLEGVEGQDLQEFEFVNLGDSSRDKLTDLLSQNIKEFIRENNLASLTDDDFDFVLKIANKGSNFVKMEKTDLIKIIENQSIPQLASEQDKLYQRIIKLVESKSFKVSEKLQLIEKLQDKYPNFASKISETPILSTLLSERSGLVRIYLKNKESEQRQISEGDFIKLLPSIYETYKEKKQDARFVELIPDFGTYLKEVYWKAHAPQKGQEYIANPMLMLLSFTARGVEYCTDENNNKIFGLLCEASGFNKVSCYQKSGQLNDLNPPENIAEFLKSHKDYAHREELIRYVNNVATQLLVADGNIELLKKFKNQNPDIFKKLFVDSIQQMPDCPQDIDFENSRLYQKSDIDINKFKSGYFGKHILVIESQLSRVGQNNGQNIITLVNSFAEFVDVFAKNVKNNDKIQKALYEGDISSPDLTYITLHILPKLKEKAKTDPSYKEALSAMEKMADSLVIKYPPQGKYEEQFNKNNQNTHLAGTKVISDLLHKSKLTSWIEGKENVSESQYTKDLNRIKKVYDNAVREDKSLSDKLKTIKVPGQEAKFSQELKSSFPTFASLVTELQKRGLAAQKPNASENKAVIGAGSQNLAKSGISSPLRPQDFVTKSSTKINPDKSKVVIYDKLASSILQESDKRIMAKSIEGFADTLAKEVEEKNDMELEGMRVAIDRSFMLMIKGQESKGTEVYHNVRKAIKEHPASTKSEKLGKLMHKFELSHVVQLLDFMGNSEKRAKNLGENEAAKLQPLAKQHKIDTNRKDWHLNLYAHILIDWGARTLSPGTQRSNLDLVLENIKKSVIKTTKDEHGNKKTEIIDPSLLQIFQEQLQSCKRKITVTEIDPKTQKPKIDPKTKHFVSKEIEVNEFIAQDKHFGMFKTPASKDRDGQPDKAQAGASITSTSRVSVGSTETKAHKTGSKAGDRPNKKDYILLDKEITASLQSSLGRGESSKLIEREKEPEHKHNHGASLGNERQQQKNDNLNPQVKIR